MASQNTKVPRHRPLCGEFTGAGELPHKGPATRKMFPFDDAIMRRYFADDSFKCIFLKEKCMTFRFRSHWLLFRTFELTNIPALVQIMAWRRSRDKPPPEPMMVNSLAHICDTRLQWVKCIHSLGSVWTSCIAYRDSEFLLRRVYSHFTYQWSVKEMSRSICSHSIDKNTVSVHCWGQLYAAYINILRMFLCVPDHWTLYFSGRIKNKIKTKNHWYRWKRNLVTNRQWNRFGRELQAVTQGVSDIKKNGWQVMSY